MKYILDFKRDYKDVFGAYMLKGAEYDVEHYDIPYVDVIEDIVLPDKLISYGKINQADPNNNTFAHFYQDDYIFDGTYGIWNALLYDQHFKKDSALRNLTMSEGLYVQITAFMEICRKTRRYGMSAEAEESEVTSTESGYLQFPMFIGWDRKATSIALPV